MMLKPVTFAVVLLMSTLRAQAADAQVWPPSGAFYGDPAVPDISGLWLGTAMGIPGKGAVSNTGETADGRSPNYWAPWPLPYTPAYQKIYNERVAAAKQGRALGDIGARCLPFGLPHMLASMLYPHEVVQTPGQVTLFIFGTFPIMIWTDGRTHPKDLAPSYNGHSIGYWIGDTLFVDTVGIKDTTPLDTNRDPHSAKLTMKWTVQRVADDTIHVHLTLYDADAFTEPVTMTNIWRRETSRRWAVLDDQSCFENNQDVPPPPGTEGFIKF